MKKKLVIAILGLVCFCMAGCAAPTNSSGGNMSDEAKNETTTDVQTDEKTETESETETIIYDNEVNGEDEYYGNEIEYEEEVEEEYFEDVAE